jgi:hypothetical protein
MVIDKQIRLDALNFAILGKPSGCSADDVLAAATKFARFIETGATEADGGHTSRGVVVPPNIPVP